MASTYTAFLSSPNASHLAPEASLDYITTLTTLHTPAAILKHLTSQSKHVVKKSENILNSIEGPQSLFLETETTLQFNDGGGAYLPGMDGNLLDEKLVTFPLLHVVGFDEEGKIKQIRLYWDQGTLLKQVEAIGRTGRNWPIRDGKAQCEHIVKSVKAGSSSTSTSTNNNTSKTPLASRDPNEVATNNQHKPSSTTTNARNPQDLFTPRDINEGSTGTYAGPKTAPRASAKPAPRDMGDLFAGEEAATAAGAAPNQGARPGSPVKDLGVTHKAGAGTRDTRNRLFDENEPLAGVRSPEKKKTYGQKYEHFDFGDGEDAPAMQEIRPVSGKGAATFSFEDFSTPLKPKGRGRREDDEVHWGSTEVPPSPPKRPVVHAPRNDANTHFNMTSETLSTDSSFPSAATHVDNARRGNDFAAHYSMTDSPSTNDSVTGSDRPVSRSARPDQEQHWGFSTPKEEKKIYRTAGDGMGSRKTAGEAAEEGAVRQIYKTQGDGMGGKKGRVGGDWWDFGNGEDEVTQRAGRGGTRA